MSPPPRPTAETPAHQVWCFQAQLVEDEARLDAIRRTHGKYVIATNMLDEEDLALSAMLTIYKGQSTSVERGFWFLKDPLFLPTACF